MTLSQQIQALVTQFTSDLEALVRSAAVGAVQDALGAPSAPARALVAAKRHKTVQKPAGRPAGATAKPATKRATAARVRRSPEQLEATAARIVAHVSAHPGQGAEEIKKALGLNSAGWMGPLKLAIDSKRLTRKGDRRAAKYHAAAPKAGPVPPVKRQPKAA